jgi:hypothetical protein
MDNAFMPDEIAELGGPISQTASGHQIGEEPPHVALVEAQAVIGREGLAAPAALPETRPAVPAYQPSASFLIEIGRELGQRGGARFGTK